MYWCLLPLIHPSLASIMAILKVWWVSLPIWSGLEFIQQLLKRLHNEFCTDIDDPLRMNLTNFVDHPAFPPAEASRSHLCHLRCRFICNFYWSIRCFWFYLQWALQLHRVSRPYSSAIENGLTCSVSHCKFSFLFLCWWFHMRTVSSHALTRCQVRTSLSVLCLPLYRFQPHLHSGG